MKTRLFTLTAWAGFLASALCRARMPAGLRAAGARGGQPTRQACPPYNGFAGFPMTPLWLAIAICVMLVTGSAHAADRFYVGPGGGNWNDAANWSATPGGAGGASVPVPGDDAFVTNTVARTVNFNATYASQLSSLILDGAGIQMKIVQSSAATALIARDVIIGLTGIGRYEQSDGTNTISPAGGDDAFFLGNSPGSDGTYHMTGGTLDALSTKFQGALIVGNSGKGTFDLAGASATVTAKGVTVGNVGTGIINHTGGTIIVGGPTAIYNLILGFNAGATGSYNIDTADGSSVLTIHGQFQVGYGGSGIVTQYDGTVNVTNTTPTGYIYIASSIGSSGNYIMDDGLLNADAIFVGGDVSSAGGPGVLTQNGGAVVLNTGLIVWPGGTVNLNDGVLNLGTTAADNIRNEGIINMSGGQLNLAGRIFGNGVVNQTAGASTFANGTAIDTADIAISGGTATAAGTLLVGKANSSTGIVNMAGGTLTVTNGMFGVGNTGTVVGGGGVGQVTVSNATMLANTILLGSTAGGQGSLTIQSGGTVSFPGSNALLSVNSLSVLGGALPVGVLDMVNGTLKVGVVSNGTMTVDGGIANCADVIIGEDTLGTCRMKTGTLTMSSVLTVGNNAASTGIIWMDGGNWLSSSRTTIGNNGVGQMTISNGTITLPRIVVSGIGTSANPGTFTIAGGAVFSTNLVAGFEVNSTGTVWVATGNLSVTNAGTTAQLVVGRSGRGALTLSNGTLIVDQLLVTNSTKSTFSFAGGTLKTRSTLVTNGAPFVVGDSVTTATLNLLGGVHSFGNGLRIRSNSVLSGCGTINGNVVVDAGATVLADCGGTITFTGILTNNGLLRATSGTVLESYSSVVNNGLIDIMTGATNFHSTFINNGSVADVSYFRVVSIVKQGNAVNITWATVGGRSNVVQFTAGIGGSYSNNFNNLSSLIVMPGASLGQTNYLDMGGATNRPARYYRVRVSP